MRLVIRILLSALAVMILAYVLPGVHVYNYISAIIVAIILSLLNIVIKPILVILTLPVTILTFGLFLLVINAFIILFAESLVSGFVVDGFWWALIFSLLLSLLQSLFTAGLDEEKQ